MLFISSIKEIVYYYLALNKAQEILRIVSKSKLKIATAESCTGGLLGAIFTAIPGSSESFSGGVIAYDNNIKNSILSVSKNTLNEQGAVSKQTVIEMGAGLIPLFSVDIALSVSGIAGPGGATPGKPIGTIWTNISVAKKTEQAVNDGHIIHYPFKISYNKGRNVNRIYSAYHLLKRLEKVILNTREN